MVSPARTSPGLVRRLQERPAELAKEAARSDRPDREELPERDLARQLRLPDARVRADGDAVCWFVPDRPRRSSRSRCRGTSTGTPATGVLQERLRSRGRRPRRAGPLREEGDQRRIPLPVRLEGAGGDPPTAATSTCRGTRPSRREPRVLRSSPRPRSTSSRHRRTARIPTGPRSRSSSTATARRRIRGEKRVVLGLRRSWRRTRSLSYRCSRSGPRSWTCAISSGPTSRRTCSRSTTTRPRSASSTGARTRSGRRRA